MSVLGNQLGDTATPSKSMDHIVSSAKIEGWIEQTSLNHSFIPSQNTSLTWAVSQANVTAPWGLRVSQRDYIRVWTPHLLNNSYSWGLLESRVTWPHVTTQADMERGLSPNCPLCMPPAAALGKWLVMGKCDLQLKGSKTPQLQEAPWGAAETSLENTS